MQVSSSPWQSWELQEHSKGASRFLLAHHKREEEAWKEVEVLLNTSLKIRLYFLFYSKLKVLEEPESHDVTTCKSKVTAGRWSEVWHGNCPVDAKTAEMETPD